jgi:hypothetical protein
MPDNFSWQFDDSFFNRITDGNGLAGALNLSTKITTYANNVVKEIESLHRHGPRPTSALPSSDIDEFPELLALVIDKKQELEGINQKDRLEVRQKYVDIRPERDLIAWELKSRRPGLFGQGKVGSKHVQEYTMHLRGVFEDPYEPGHVIAAFGQKMDNFVELCIMSGDPQSANRHAIWLEETMEEARWIFQYNGFERLLFDERREDQFRDIGSNPCHMRPLIYYVRTEKIVLHRVALLRKLIFDLCVSPPGERPGDAAKFSSVLQK